ncbi:AbiH family protein [Lactobacillus johnsonii]|uniref:AbiH family protein n=1 Tax=Lactobacillus johnsonii TaxID=33959 RepID=UPI003D7801AB
MENENKKQLIILGNGFDLACGLKSSYKNFFEQRFEKVKPEKIVKTIQKHKPNNNGSALNLDAYGLCNQELNTFNTKYYHEPIKFKHSTIEFSYKITKYTHTVNYFDLLFMATKIYMDSDNSWLWSNIEQILQEMLQIVYEEVKEKTFNDEEELNKAKELENKYFNNYDFKSNDDKLNLIKFILHIFNKTTEEDKEDQIKKALKQYEETFGHFITNQIKFNDKYLDNVSKKLTQLTEKETYILNFNYSATSLLDEQIRKNIYPSNSVKEWVNIHGLSRWKGKNRTKIIHDYIHNNNLKVPRPIFGISKYDENNSRLLDDGNSLYKFTKTKRREEAFENLGFNPQEEDTKIIDFSSKKKKKEKKVQKETHFTVPSDINLITIFGHSLGMTDYDYFNDIFHKLNLKGKKVKLEVYYHGNNLPSLKKSLKRILKEYSNDDLYTDLCNKGLLVFRNAIDME